MGHATRYLRPRTLPSEAPYGPCQKPSLSRCEECIFACAGVGAGVGVGIGYSALAGAVSVTVGDQGSNAACCSHFFSSTSLIPWKILLRSSQIDLPLILIPDSTHIFMARAASSSLITRHEPSPFRLPTRIPRSL